MSSATLQEELGQLKKSCHTKISDSKLVTCTRALVRVEINKSKIKSLVVILQFPEDYPQHELLVELRSKTLDDKLLDGLTRVCDEEARKYLGEPQIFLVLKFISKFIDDNSLCCCSSEISRIKRELITKEDTIKLKQKTSMISLELQEGAYFYNCSISIPNEYPENQAEIETTASNFPISFTKVFVAHAKEIARRCVDPPLNKNLKGAGQFKPQPSLFPASTFLIEHVHKYPTETCPYCKQRCFPEKPQNVIHDEGHDLHVERLHCGHLYHLGCLIKYLKTPPFAGGKKCQVCQKGVFHDKYKVSPALAEARWAHQQARQREIEEVVEFLS